MNANRYPVFLTKLKLYHNYLKGMEERNSLDRYMLQRSLLVQIKKDACDICEDDFADKQEFLTFMKEEKFIEEEINKTNEILEREFHIRID